jgi:TDG/mug DNA glycosylase family protein
VTHCIGFDAVSRSDARLLVLGSLPGAESLKQGRYYAKKQNSFWRIMGELVGALPDLPYQDRLDCLTRNGIALWDVCATAVRAGSLDSDIRSPVPNDFAGFFATHLFIERVCFNGRAAEALFRRHVAPRISVPLNYATLPSTSPAHAGMRFEDKLVLWREALCL